MAPPRRGAVEPLGGHDATSKATGIAIDACGNSATCIFTVNVIGAARAFDFDGAGKADIAVYRQSTSEWFIRRSSDLVLTLVAWGSPFLLDVPVTGDYNGDGKTDVAVYRRSTGEWFVMLSGGGVLTVPWGPPPLSDVPVSASGAR